MSDAAAGWPGKCCIAASADSLGWRVSGQSVGRSHAVDPTRASQSLRVATALLPGNTLQAAMKTFTLASPKGLRDLWTGSNGGSND
jgi:hypothetical protein